MQPLLSPVDYESRHGPYDIEDEEEVNVEAAPLLPRFPRPQREISMKTIVVVGLLLVILMAGLTIGVYLLILETSSDNLVPRDRTLPLFVPREHWDPMTSHFTEPRSVFNATSLIVEQTYSIQCSLEEACINLMMELEANIDENKTLPYNFMISSDGYIYEYLGWEYPSHMYPGKNALVVAFIGNFVQEMPSTKQIESAANILTESVSNGYLKKDFILTVQKEKFLGADIIRNTMINKYKATEETARRFSPRLNALRSDE